MLKMISELRCHPECETAPDLSDKKKTYKLRPEKAINRMDIDKLRKLVQKSVCGL